MKIAGVVTEYNPFHNGHRYQIEQMRKNGVTHTVAVMSGNFVQRGEFAIASKWLRARAAVMNGIDLVIELPSPYALSSAQGFAQSAVYILNALGCVDELYFGCECGDVEAIKRVSAAMLCDDFSQKLSLSISDGISYPSAVESAVCKILGEGYNGELKMPNNLLAIEYVNALSRMGSAIEPRAVERIGVEHDSEGSSGAFMSASAIRQSLVNQGVNEVGGFVPEGALELMKAEAEKGRFPCDYCKLELAFLTKLRGLGIDDFRAIPDVSEGLENRIFDAVRSGKSVNEITEKIKTKRYTHSRIRRIILRSFLGLTADFNASPPPYARILALSENGREIVKKAKAVASIPIITKSAHIM
ncbi:MAG: nucleotidyltransferase family protein, partial [Clostridia bacterium]|nr:nucleotidyltransferase family protein [Clostridia bacterium]